MDLNNCLSEDHYQLLLASLKHEQETPKPWNERFVVDCGSVSGSDNSTCLWNSLLCWYVFIHSDLFGDIYTFTEFKKLFYKNDPEEMPFQKCATPQDIQRIADFLNIYIKVLEVDGCQDYLPKDMDQPVSELAICKLVLYDGHYQLLAEHDHQAQYLKKMIELSYWKNLLSN